MKKQINELAAILDEGLKIDRADKEVIRAFTEKKAKEGKKLTTDGTRLDGTWMGGRGIAEWKGGKIHFNDLGSKAAEVAQKAVRKEAPKNWLAEERLNEAMGGQIFVFDKKNDIEFILDPTIGFLQIGMGGEWWSGKVRSGKNVFRHKKESVDPGYRPVTVVMKDKGDNLSFDVSGGFGMEGTIVIGGK
jgi:hypothetical protein